MASVQMMQIVQTGLKYFFDVDPALTEHMSRYLISQAAVAAQDAVNHMRSLGSRCTDLAAPIVHDLRELRILGHDV